MGDSVYTTQWNVAVMTPPSKFLEYLNKCSVEGIVQKANKFTFRCPLCGDSEKSSSKRRGFLLTKMDGNAAMGCHNCGHRGSFKDYLKKEKPIIYSQWVKDVFIGISLDKKVAEQHENAVTEELTSREEVVDYSKFLPIDIKRESKVRSMAIKFIKDRKIPKHIAKQFKYCESGRYYGRIILPHYNKDGTYKHFEARDLRPDPWVRYLYPENWNPSCYNKPNIDYGRTYFVFEGAIDSMFLQNSGACGGAQKYDFFFSEMHKTHKNNGIIFADSDKDGLKVAYKYLKKGYRVFMWTREMLEYGKDLNDLVKKGFFSEGQMNPDGTVLESVIMKYVVSPSIGDILCFQLNALTLGVNVLETNKDAWIARQKYKADRATRKGWEW